MLAEIWQSRNETPKRALLVKANVQKHDRIRAPVFMGEPSAEFDLFRQVERPGMVRPESLTNASRALLWKIRSRLKTDSSLYKYTALA